VLKRYITPNHALALWAGLFLSTYLVLVFTPLGYVVLTPLDSLFHSVCGCIELV